MSMSIFDEKAAIPNEELVSAVLMKKKDLWDNIKDHIATTYGKAKEEWKYYTKSAGWTLVVKSGKRTLIYFIPLSEYFKVNFVFGEKAVAEAQAANLPEHVLKTILEAKPYMEGRSFMVDVNTEDDVELVKKLLKIKNDN